MIWFSSDRIPAGEWRFIITIRNSLLAIESSLSSAVDLTDGSGNLLFTGSMEAYRQAVLRRALDLALATIALWNQSLLVGSAVCSRSLLETIAIFHSFLTRAAKHAKNSDWAAIGTLIDAYCEHTTSEPATRSVAAEKIPRIGVAVKEFTTLHQPGAERFWDQISDFAHPNGKRMMSFFGAVDGKKYIAHTNQDRERSIFVAIYNALYSCCWLASSDLDFDIVVAEMLSGAHLADEHPLMKRRALVDMLVQRAVDEGLPPLP